MIKIDKTQLLNNMIQILEKDHAALVEAAKTSHEAATNEESQPENEYDTRALEASYIAGAQSKRAFEIEEALSYCKSLQIRNFNSTDPIQVSAVVELQSEDKSQIVFLMPKGAGISLNYQSLKIKVITGQSPLGQVLVGQKKGQVITVDTLKDSIDYEILDVQ
jgi:transcription elongation GreA/GreB family factor